MSASLAPLLRALQRAGLELDAEATLDSVWLAMRMHERGSTAGGGSAARSGTGATIGGAVGPEARTNIATAATPDAAGTPPDDRRARGDKLGRPLTAAPAAAARTLTLPRAAALPDSRALVKALRPLRRRVRSPGAGLIDIDTTVQRAAEEDLWIPSFRPARERWLDVMLVADHGLSMLVWKDTVDELERVLRNSGAFRSVRSWWLESDQGTLAISARGRGPVPATPEQLVRLVRGQARSIVLVVSDGVGPRWHDGAVPRLMAEWAKHLPLALLQVTPEWFWARTALGDTVGCRLRSAVPAALNHRLKLDALPAGLGGGAADDATLFRVPTASLGAAAMARLASLIAGASRVWAPGAIFDLTWGGEADAPSDAPAPPRSADERAARFRALASAGAQRLAACFAASPVRTLGVLRLLRRDLLPEAGPFIEAEVLLGGIVRVQTDTRGNDARWALGASLPLEFHPGLQPLLLDSASTADVLRALRHAARVAQSGVVPTFTSWLANPSSGAAQFDPGRSDFAAAAAASLARLGGSFARLVKPAEATPNDDASANTAADVAAEESAAPPPTRPMLRRGAKGAVVVDLQRKLGLSLADGDFGAQTEKAVRQLQVRCGLTVDGVVGPATWQQIDNAPAPMPQHPASPRGGERAVIAIGVDRVADLPALRAAAASARRVAQWATENQAIPPERVWLFTDDDGQRVGVAKVQDAVTSCIERGDLDQLIVYFAGHGAHVAQQDLWLLSDALRDPNAVVGVTQNEQLSRLSGIPHVVFIADTSRTPEAGEKARAMSGSAIFPSTTPTSTSGTAVDRFFAAGIGQASYEVKTGDDAAESEAVFTSVLLSALSGNEPRVLADHDGRQVITSRSLLGFLRHAVPERLAQFAVSLRQEPEAIVESDEGCWLASF